MPLVTRSLHVRLDQTAEAALEVIRAEGLSDSEAVRVALREAGGRRRSQSSLHAEAAVLRADPADRAEMRVVRTHMASFAA